MLLHANTIVNLQVAPLEKSSLFIVALVVSLVLTNIINHWHQTSSLDAHRLFTARLNAARASALPPAPEQHWWESAQRCRGIRIAICAAT